MNKKKIQFAYRLAAIVGVVLLIVGLSGWGLITTSQNNLVEGALVGQHALASSIAARIQDELSNDLEIMSQLVGKNIVKSMGSAGVTTELRIFQARNPNITELYVADLSGQQIAHSDLQNSSNIAWTPGFRGALQGLTVVSDLELSTGWDGGATRIYMPIVENEEIVGIFSGLTNLTRPGSLKDLTWAFDQTAMVLSWKGEVITHNHQLEMKKLPEVALEVTVAIEQELSRVPIVYTDELGREVFGLISPIGSNGWHVVIQVPVAAIKAINASLWGVYLYTMIGSAIFAFLIGWLLLRRFTLVRGKSATTSRNDEVLHRLKNIEKIVGDAQRQINTDSREINRDES